MSLDYVRLGSAGAKVSRICLGTMNFGPVIGDDDSFAILDAALDRGVNFVDTADVYGGEPWGPNPGQTEDLLGRWFAQRPGARDRIVLGTKAHGVMGPGPNDRGLSALHIRNAVDASLRRLRTDRLDLFQLHHIDRDVPADEVLEAVALLRAQGKILYMGSSNFAGWDLARYRELAAREGLPPIVTEQSVYNLAQRVIELEVVPAARHYGIGLLPWSPLAGGHLGGVLAKQDRARTSDLSALGDRRARVERYEALAAEWGIEPGVLALAWLLHQPAVTAPVVGPRTLGQFESALMALEIVLTAEQLEALDEIWPGPGGPAPEAYAW